MPPINDNKQIYMNTRECLILNIEYYRLKYGMFPKTERDFKPYDMVTCGNSKGSMKPAISIDLARLHLRITSETSKDIDYRATYDGKEYDIGASKNEASIRRDVETLKQNAL